MKIRSISCFFLFFCFLSVFSFSDSVKRVVDGDTVVLSDGRKIRLIGVDTPELHESSKLHKDALRSGQDEETIKELGAKAANFTKKYVLGKKVEVEYDLVNKKSNHLDKYGRTLAYIYVELKEIPPELALYYQKKKSDPGVFPRKIMLNRLLLQCGYAYAYTRFPFKFLDEFRKYEREARELSLGLWKEDPQ